MSNYSPTITSCVNVFLMRTILKRYIKSLTGKSVYLDLKICKSPFKFT